MWWGANSEAQIERFKTFYLDYYLEAKYIWIIWITVLRPEEATQLCTIYVLVIGTPADGGWILYVAVAHAVDFSLESTQLSFEVI